MLENIVRLVVYLLILLFIVFFAGHGYKNQGTVEFWFGVGYLIFWSSFFLGLFPFMIYQGLQRFEIFVTGKAFRFVYFSGLAAGIAIWYFMGGWIFAFQMWLTR